MIKTKYKPYPKYKPSGVEWIGEIPEGWEIVRFKQYYSFEKGKNAQLYTNEYIQANEGDYPVYSGQTENNGVMGKVNSYAYNLDEEVILITTVGARAMTHTLISGKFSLSQNIALMKKRRSEYHTRFIFYFLFPLIEKEKGSIALVMQPSLRFEDLNKYYTCLPPLPEQKAIAAFLDRETERINGIIAKQKRMIELLKEKRSALITQAVTKGLDPKAKMKPSGVEWIGEIPEGWEVTSLKRALEQKITDGPHETPELIPDGIPFISAEAIKNNKIDFDLRRGDISKKLHDKYCKKAKPKLNDILFIKSGATTGNIAYVETTEEFSIWSPLALIRCNNQLLFYKYLFYLMLSNEFRIQVELAWSYGTQQNIGMGVIGRLIIILPPLPEQKAIAAFLDRETAKIDTLVSKIEKQIELLNEYKQSLITHAVTGKIDVRGEVNA